MSFFKTFMATFGGVSDLQSPQPWLFDAIGFRTVAGERVSPSNAMALSAVYACINRISSDVMQLPVEFFEQRGNVEAAIDDPLEYLFNEIANPDMSGASFKQALEMVVQGWGNAYAEIQRDGRNNPVAMWPIHPSRVKIIRKNDGQIVYQVYYQQMDLTPETNRYMEFDQADIFHIHLMSENGLVGISPIMAGREEMAVGLAAQKLAASFFSNGAKLSGVLEHPAKLDKDVMIRLRSSWNEIHGGAAKGNKVAILEQGMTFKPMSISPEASQFLETRKFEVEEVCRRYNVPTHKVQQTEKPIGYNGLEQMNAAYVQDCIVPNCIHWESEIRRKFLFDRPKVRARFRVDELKRGDHAARVAYIIGRINAGTMTPNEGRILEHDNPSSNPALDEFYMQGANKTLTQIANPPPAPGGAATEVPEDKEAESDDGPEAIVRQLPIVEEAFIRVATKECNRIEQLAEKHTGKRGVFAAQVSAFMQTQIEFYRAALSPFLKANGLDANTGAALIAAKCAQAEEHWLNAFDRSAVPAWRDTRLTYAVSDALEFIHIVKELRK